VNVSLRAGGGSVKKICLSEASEQSSASIPISPEQNPSAIAKTGG
jgi:hypothetical protein